MIGQPVTDITLTNDEIRRYSRHLIMPEVGMAGQKKLKAARVLLVGAGGLGSPSALYLAAAGVGTLGIVDFDVVDDSNLQRQVLHGTSTVGKPKLASAMARLSDLNPFVKVIPHEVRLSSENALEIFKDYDIIADGTDNFQTRYLTNDACALLGKPNVYASIFRFEGQVSVFDATRGPCYRCLYAEPPPPGLVPSCAEGGVLGILPGVVGVMQATEVVKLILGVGEPLIGRLLLFDALSMTFRELKLRKDPDCPLCGEHPTLDHLIDYDQFCGVGTSHSAPEAEQPGWEIGARDVSAMLARGEDFVLLDVRNPHEWDIAHIKGARLLPLSELGERSAELPRDTLIVTQCKAGVRSMKALNLLREAGFTRLKSMRGGIESWIDQVDPSLPKY